MDIEILYPLISEAIRRAEILEDLRAPGAQAAYLDVSILEEKVAEALPASDPEGALARRGAVRAALAGREPARAKQLTERFLAEPEADAELRADLFRLLDQFEHSLEPPRKGFIEHLVHHVSLPVRDLGRATAFYRDVLNLKSMDRPPSSFSDAWFELPGGGQYLHLVYSPSGTFREGDDIKPSDSHFVLRASTWREVFELLRRKKLRYRLENQQLYILDPDDHIIEINAPGTPVPEAGREVLSQSTD